MAVPTYENFVLLITQAPQGYQARVIASPVGDDAAVDFDLPPGWQDLGGALWHLSGRRRGSGPVDRAAVDAADLGRRLYDTVFAGEVGASLVRNLAQANGHLRIVLRLDRGLAALAALPWEFLYSSHLQRYLAPSVETPLVRYLEVAQGGRMQPVTPPLVVLGVLSNPAGVESLDVEGEWARVQEAVAGLGSGQVRLERVPATWSALQSRLRQGAAHVLHFIGHGVFDEATNQGGLLFEDESGQPTLISAQRFKILLHDQPELRLVFLNACEGARGGRSDSFAGVAQQLVLQGIPAVVAMQFPVTDEAAITLSREFYTALADGYPVDAAVGEARKAIFGLGESLEWATPVLFSRSENNRLIQGSEPSTDTAAQTGGIWQYYRRHRRVVNGLGLAFLLLLMGLMVADMPPFAPRPAWLPISPEIPNVHVGYDAGITLVVGANNEEEGCTQPQKGIWYRPMGSEEWLQSQVGEHLCHQYLNTEALDNIQQITGFPEQPATVYLLTSHKGILVSRDGGAAFAPLPGGVPPLPQDSYAISLVLSGTPADPVFWVAGSSRGLWRMAGGQWQRMDGDDDGGCAGLPDTRVTGLLFAVDRLLIGTDGNGLWVTEDQGGSCRRVFDAQGTYRFNALRYALLDGRVHYLAGVQVVLGEPEKDYGRQQLLYLCPRADSCTPDAWSADPVPLWHNGPTFTGTLADVSLGYGDTQLPQWTVLTGLGGVVAGNLEGERWRLGAIRRCLPLCDEHTGLVPAHQAGANPYLLGGDRVYVYDEGKWLQSLWP